LRIVGLTVGGTACRCSGALFFFMLKSDPC
jgi:hypothetical protein